MKAAVVVAPNDIRIDDIPEPTCGPGMVKVAVAYCGICGSDLPRVLKGTCHSFPQVLGHEFSGIVTEIGVGVTNIAVGDHVVGVPLIPCHSCEDCKNGDFSLCKHYSFVGSRQQGAMAERVVLPAVNVIRLDDSVSLEQAALIEPSTVALHGVLMQGGTLQDCETVAVIGLGPIALFALQWCKILGARHIIVIGRSRERLSIAKKYGAHHVFSTLDKNCVDQIKSVVGKCGCRAVFDVVGSEETVKLAMNVVSNKGKVCLIGTPTESIDFPVKEECLDKWALW